MKNIFLSLIIIAESITAMAQETKKEKQHKWQISVHANTIEKMPSIGNFLIDGKYLWGAEKNKSFSYGIAVNYCINENISLRFKTGYFRRNEIQDEGNADSASTPTGALIQHAETTEDNYYFSPGIQWNFKKNNVIPYVGFELPFTLYEPIKIIYTENAISNNALNSTDVTNINVPGGYSYGIGAFGGFDVKITKHFYAGAEISFAYLYSVIAKGITTEDNIAYFYYPALPTEYSHIQVNNKTEQLGIFKINGSLHISYWF